MPLVRKKRVIEYACSWGKLLKFLFCKRDCLLLRSPLECAVVLDLAYLTELGKVSGNLINWMLIAEADHIPEMKAFLTCPVLRAEIHREDSFDLITVHKVKDLVYAEYARTRHRRIQTASSKTGLVENITHARIKADKKLTSDYILRQLGNLLNIGLWACHRSVDRTRCRS